MRFLIISQFTILSLFPLSFFASPFVGHFRDVKRKRMKLFLIRFAESAMFGQRHDRRQAVVHVVDVLVGVSAEIHASRHAGERTPRKFAQSTMRRDFLRVHLKKRGRGK